MFSSKCHSIIVSCNYPSLPPLPKTLTLISRSQLPLNPKTLIPASFLLPRARALSSRVADSPQISRGSVPRSDVASPIEEKENSPHISRGSVPRSDVESPIVEKERGGGAGRNGDGGGGGGGSGNGSDWTTSLLLFGLWAGLMYYVFRMAPDQTPYRDMYFLQKLLNLKGDDGFRMNEVLVALWYIMGLWPLVYSMLLIPTGRSSKTKIPVWPFLVLSCVGGAYALIPYFVLWKPPPPPVNEDGVNRWPLNFLESRITAGVTLAAGLGLIAYAGFAGEDNWREFYQYLRESKFIHVTCIDFSLLYAFSPFWVYNDMTARRW
ncbi:uncharacterized protein LOC109725318 [Ananas comosus]|uniref:Uncharacterized protein LOC109725318 n=1 Tax=Ananas comosus TaxID=4615 RepID=A0A6P5GWN3_ANACO|nr:uncharacterized protein LOC109725318 [Ananas comosus]